METPPTTSSNGIKPSLSSIAIEQEMQQSYLDYAMSVIVGRAIPDVRDGLKPVQRRILYAMFEEGHLSTKKHSKCAGVVGEVLKRLHPHGDSSVYDALVRLAQTWNIRYPLIDGQGNFGDIDGDSPAAYRYTESRLTALAETLLEDLDRDTVDMVPNFDDSNFEPTVLPARIPNLLVNGSDGIAVGMATHVLPHNLSEVISGTIAVINNPDLSIAELIEIIPAPDFPTGGLILGKSAAKSAAAKGRGSIQIRSKTHIETIKNNTREVEAIVVTEIPYQVNKSRLVERIAELVNSKQVEGISRLRDESDRKGIRIVIEVKKDATPEVVLNQLFVSSSLQISVSIINLAIVEGRPQLCSLRTLIDKFIDHRRDVVTRRTRFLLGQCRSRMHLLEGFRVVLLNLDTIITLIKNSDSPATAKEDLKVKFNLTPVQAQAILELRLQKLTSLERLAIENEFTELSLEIKRLENILADGAQVNNIIVDELSSIKDRFGDARRSEIIELEEDFDFEDLIEDQEVAITISHRGYVKRMPLQTYKAQNRGGKGITGASAKEDDFIEHFFTASTKSKLLVFTTLGRVYWLAVHKIPEVSRLARGRAIVNLLSLQEDEKINAFLAVKDFDPNLSVVMATKKGTVKKLSLKEFSRPRKGGIIACTLEDGDNLVGVGISNGAQDVILTTRSGMAIRFNEEQLREMGRAARGVRGMQMDSEDAVVSMVIVSPYNESSDASVVENDQSLLTVCENGYGKRTLLTNYRSQSRGGKGVIDIQTSNRNGPVVGALSVATNDHLMLITSSGKVIRIKVNQLSVIGRNTQGVKLINLDEEEKVLAVTFLAESDADFEDSLVEIKDEV
jgi:DNA gyrase subunit A